jgi:hypothetical protein
VAFVGRLEHGGDWRLVAMGDEGSSIAVLEGNAATAFFGFGDHLSHPDFGLVAIELGPREWIVRDGRGKRLLIAPEGTRVVGVTRSPRRREEVGLVILEGDDPEESASRHALAIALHEAPSSPGVRTLARAAVRASIRDSASFGPRLTTNQYRRLLARTEDGALRTDAPPLPSPRGPVLAERDTPLRVGLASADVGLLPVWDAALLPNGHVALAVGEAGVRIVSPRGGVAAHLSAPAHRLVVSDHGDRLIALARRGEVWRLSRVDLASRRAEAWCDARINAFATDYDGGIWFAATTDLFAIDAMASRFDCLWRAPDVCSPEATAFMRMARSASRLVVHVVNRGSQVWSYELPSLILRSRADVPARGDRAVVGHLGLGASTEGMVVERHRHVDRETTAGKAPAVGPIDLRLISGDRVTSAQVGGADEHPGEPALTKEWVATWLRGPDGCRVLLLDTKGPRRAEIRLARAQRVSLRLGKEFLTIGDDTGRLLLVELGQGRSPSDHLQPRGGARDTFRRGLHRDGRAADRRTRRAPGPEQPQEHGLRGQAIHRPEIQLQRCRGGPAFPPLSARRRARRRCPPPYRGQRLLDAGGLACYGT